MTKNSLKNGPDEFGYYGEFGSRYAPEILMPNLIELENFLYKIYINKNLKLENLSGILKVNFNNVDNKVINSGLFTIKFENSKSYIEEKIFYLGNMM